MCPTFAPRKTLCSGSIAMTNRLAQHYTGILIQLRHHSMSSYIGGASWCDYCTETRTIPTIL